jgi:hypothetical protein
VGLGTSRFMPRIDRGPARVDSILDPPPPPLKVDQSGGSEKHLEPSICMLFSPPQICARSLSHIPDPPPPSIKGRMDGGVRNPIQTVDLSTETWAVQMRACIISDFPPPPPPPSVKGRTVGGVRKDLSTVDLGAIIWTVDI